MHGLCRSKSAKVKYDSIYEYTYGTMGSQVANKLFASEYEETTWSARTWTTFAAQKLSVALHYAAATEISAALSVPRFDGAELTAVAAMRGGG